MLWPHTEEVSYQCLYMGVLTIHYTGAIELVEQQHWVVRIDRMQAINT